MPTSPVSPQIALARSLSEQERRRRQAAEAQVRLRLNDPILRKFLLVLFSRFAVDDPCQAAQNCGRRVAGVAGVGGDERDERSTPGAAARNREPSRTLAAVQSSLD